MSFKIDKIYTDNPYIDELVYYTKILAANTVLKMQDAADKYETEESLREAGLLIACKEGTATLELFPNITKTALNNAGIFDDYDVLLYMTNTNKIPADKRKAITDAMVKEYIDTYEEKNTYYRMLHGLPAIGDEDYVEDWEIPDGVIINTETPIHMMTSAEISILETYGILESMYEKDPINHEYMRHLGSKAIDYYFARKANRFDLLYLPEIEHESIYKMYRNKIDDNKFYVLHAVYSEAFKYGSDYYDNIMAIFIVIITMIDVISRVHEYIAKKEIFDIRSIQYIFKSFGIPFFEEIPMRYQTLMIKNLHTLIKYKSTYKCMVDICSLFGFDNISIFKYYLLKQRNIGDDGKYVYATKENGEEDLEKEYTLKFIKMPMNDDINEHIRLGNSYIDYDELTLMDTSWDGGLDHNLVKNNILKENFNIIRTKYMSIDTSVDMAKTSMQQTYILNMLYNDIRDSKGNSLLSNLSFKIPYIDQNAKFKLADALTALTALSYIYRDFEDIILTSPTQVLYVNGFNFNADIGTLMSDIKSRGLSTSSNDKPSLNHAISQLESFQIPEGSILSINEFLSIYKNNIAIREELAEGMRLADSKDLYDVYNNLYNALMITELTLNLYKDENGDFYKDANGDITYTAYLEQNAPLLYAAIVKGKEIVDTDSRKQYISNLIDSIVYSVESYLDTDEFNSIFNNLPTVNSDSVKQYMLTVLNFYKSYKVDFVMGSNTVYTMDDMIDSYIQLIDKIFMSRNFTRLDNITMSDLYSSVKISKSIKDNISMVDRLYISYTSQ